MTGRKLLKVSREGKVLLEAPVTFGWLSRSLAVNETDGSMWVSESAHPDLRESQNRLFIVAADGQVRKQIELGEVMPGTIALDVSRGVGWISTSSELLKMSLDGDVQTKLPVTGELCVEPDTGCVWVGGATGIFRIDPSGAPIWSKPAVAKTVKVLCALGEN